jgi:hypothetical protein
VEAQVFHNLLAPERLVREIVVAHKVFIMAVEVAVLVVSAEQEIQAPVRQARQVALV